MGFSEIYLIGADTSYAKKGPQHFIETGIKDPHYHIAGERMIRAYQVAKKYAEITGHKFVDMVRIEGKSVSGIIKVYFNNYPDKKEEVLCSLPLYF